MVFMSTGRELGCLRMDAQPWKMAENVRAKHSRGQTCLAWEATVIIIIHESSAKVRTQKFESVWGTLCRDVARVGM